MCGCFICRGVLLLAHEFLYFVMGAGVVDGCQDSGHDRQVEPVPDCLPSTTTPAAVAIVFLSGVFFILLHHAFFPASCSLLVSLQLMGSVYGAEDNYW